MFQPFTPPKSVYLLPYQEVSFKLTWRVNMFMLVLFVPLLLMSFFINKTIVIASLFNAIIPIVSLVLLQVNRTYKLSAYILVVVGGIFPGILLNMNVFDFHMIEFAFMSISTLFGFVVLGVQVGVVSLSVQFLWFMYFLLTKEIDNVMGMQLIGIAFAMLVAMAVIGFLLVEFIHIRKSAENKYISINRDLTDINQLVNAQNKEKTVMLKEIHHRVKNNLQVISSLLRLQSYEIEEESTRSHFQDAIHRVSAMALIHEKMYQNENLSKINLKNYIETLAQDLIRTHAKGIEIELIVHSDLDELGNDTLVPVALILNELITNSLKHAFSGCQTGIINVDILASNRVDYFNFIYRDNGTWQEAKRKNSFGIELIGTLTEQLDGEVKRTSGIGTKYQFILRDLR